jgi:SAM-dependent methyltransferase
VPEERARTSAWDSDDNAARYAEFAAEFPMYRETSRDLVRLAGLAPDAVVIDLACGTGATTAEILAVLGPGGRVTGVDRSAAMLAVAARSVADARVSWVRAKAEEFDKALMWPADAVICNSAIWQTDFAATARAAHAALMTGGDFVFNIGGEFVHSDTDPPGSVKEFPLIAVMRQIAADEYGWSPPADSTWRRPRLTRSGVEQKLHTAGFVIRHSGWVEYERTAESERAWLEVPVFTDGRLPGLPYQARMAVLDKAYQRLGLAPPGMSRWLEVAATAANPVAP